MLAELDRMAWLARRMAGPGADSARKLDALRALIYKSGLWNDYRPFDYDYDNFKDLRVKLLSRYLETRLGNCITMPILFLILAERLGLNMSLASAPCHFYLRHRDEDGRNTNLEPTSGAQPARDVWIRDVVPITDRAVETGLYMRSLSRREGVAAMGELIVHYLKNARRFDEVIAVCELMLRSGPRDALALSNLGAACGNLVRSEFLDRYRSQFLIPLPLRARYSMLLHKNRAAFAAAEALGWEPFQAVGRGSDGRQVIERLPRC